MYQDYSGTVVLSRKCPEWHRDMQSNSFFNFVYASSGIAEQYSTRVRKNRKRYDSGKIDKPFFARLL